jgi:cell division protein FtsA
MVVIEDGEVQHIAVIPIGGIHITNDLAIGLKTDLDVAEAVKVQHASLNDSKRTRASVVVNRKTHTFDPDEVHMIVEARVEELFEYVDKELRKIGRSRKLPGGVVIVGGSSKLPGIADLAKEKLQLAARVGKLQGVHGLSDTVGDPAMFTAVGLMLLDMLLLPDSSTGFAVRPSGGIFGAIEGVFKRLKR